MNRMRAVIEKMAWVVAGVASLSLVYYGTVSLKEAYWYNARARSQASLVRPIFHDREFAQLLDLEPGEPGRRQVFITLTRECATCAAAVSQWVAASKASVMSGIKIVPVMIDAVQDQALPLWLATTGIEFASVVLPRDPARFPLMSGVNFAPLALVVEGGFVRCMISGTATEPGLRSCSESIRSNQPTIFVERNQI